MQTRPKLVSEFHVCCLEPPTVGSCDAHPDPKPFQGNLRDPEKDVNKAVDDPQDLFAPPAKASTERSRPPRHGKLPNITGGRHRQPAGKLVLPADHDVPRIGVRGPWGHPWTNSCSPRSNSPCRGPPAPGQSPPTGPWNRGRTRSVWWRDLRIHRRYVHKIRGPHWVSHEISASSGVLEHLCLAGARVNEVEVFVIFHHEPTLIGAPSTTWPIPRWSPLPREGFPPVFLPARRN